MLELTHGSSLHPHHRACFDVCVYVCAIRQGLRLSLSLSLSPSGPSISVGSRPVSGCEQHVFVHTDGNVIFSFALCRGEARKRETSAGFVTAFSAPKCSRATTPPMQGERCCCGIGQPQRIHADLVTPLDACPAASAPPDTAEPAAEQGGTPARGCHARTRSPTCWRRSLPSVLKRKTENARWSLPRGRSGQKTCVSYLLSVPATAPHRATEKRDQPSKIAARRGADAVQIAAGRSTLMLT